MMAAVLMQIASVNAATTDALAARAQAEAAYAAAGVMKPGQSISLGSPLTAPSAPRKQDEDFTMPIIGALILGGLLF